MLQRILTTIFLISLLQLNAQEWPIAKHYLHNKFLANPAVAGEDACDEIRLVHRQQWIGMSEAPRTSALSYHGRIWEGLGIGGYVYNDRNGLTNENGFQLATAYHISLTKSRMLAHRISFGLAANLGMRTLNTGKLTDDIFLNPPGTASEAVAGGLHMIPNVSAGINYVNKNLFFGFSALNLVKNVPGLGAAKNSPSGSEPFLPMNFFINGGYYINLSSEWGFEPSTMVKLDKDMRKQVDLNTRLFYQTEFDKYIFFGLSLRSNLDAFTLHTFMPMFGMRTNQFLVTVTYDAGLYTLQKYNYGSLELMLGWNFCRTKKIERAPCPAFKDRRVYK